jgi:putative ABC transport system substrate-binding protein
VNGDAVKRREFIMLLGGAAFVWPLAARAQQLGRLPTIGFLSGTSAAGSARPVAAFVQRLRELGWIDGRTVTIVTEGNAPALAAKQATSVVPIVFAVAGDPVGTGLVASLARPGGNVTGLSVQSSDLAGKRLELLREVVPGLHRLAVMGNIDSPSAVLQIGEVHAAARILGLDVVTLEIQRVEDIAPALESLKGRADALYVSGDTFMSTHRTRISTLAQDARLPMTSNFREFVEAGCLMSYGPNFPDLFRRAGDYVDKILRGAKPGDLPVEQPTKFDLVINLTTAKALGLMIPEAFLVRADEVIE